MTNTDEHMNTEDDHYLINSNSSQIIDALRNHAELTDRTGEFYNCWGQDDYANLLIEFNYDLKKCINQINGLCDVYQDRMNDAQAQTETETY